MSAGPRVKELLFMLCNMQARETWNIASHFEKPARLIIRLLFGFVSDSVFVKLNKNENKY